ncbi:hypothetical protein [Dictyobacter arantiisoli]|uniref:hypothetical protein n=1 Tax=Dictyobacter arantiisoli TaxID=2014874 RepID=UPI0011ED0ED4|nr:hypothetical protein [Dictyobacter arantiisoli]
MSSIISTAAATQWGLLEQVDIKPFQTIYNADILSEGFVLFPVALERYYPQLGVSRAEFALIRKLLELWNQQGELPWLTSLELETVLNKSKRQIQRDTRRLANDGFLIIREWNDPAAGGTRYLQYDCTPFLQRITQLVQKRQHSQVRPGAPLHLVPDISPKTSLTKETDLPRVTSLSQNLSMPRATSLSQNPNLSLSSQITAKAASQASSQLSATSSSQSPDMSDTTCQCNGTNMSSVTNVPVADVRVRVSNISNSKFNNYINIIIKLLDVSNSNSNSSNDDKIDNKKTENKTSRSSVSDPVDNVYVVDVNVKNDSSDTHDPNAVDVQVSMSDNDDQDVETEGSDNDDQDVETEGSDNDDQDVETEGSDNDDQEIMKTHVSVCNRYDPGDMYDHESQDDQDGVAVQYSSPQAFMRSEQVVQREQAQDVMPEASVQQDARAGDDIEQVDTVKPPPSGYVRARIRANSKKRAEREAAQAVQAPKSAIWSQSSSRLQPVEVEAEPEPESEPICINQPVSPESGEQPASTDSVSQPAPETQRQPRMQRVVNLQDKATAALSEVSHALGDTYWERTYRSAVRIFNALLGINDVRDHLMIQQPDAYFADLIRHVASKVYPLDMAELEANGQPSGMLLFMDKLNRFARYQYYHVMNLRNQPDYVPPPPRPLAAIEQPCTYSVSNTIPDGSGREIPPSQFGRPDLPYGQELLAIARYLRVKIAWGDSKQILLCTAPAQLVLDIQEAVLQAFNAQQGQMDPTAN